MGQARATSGSIEEIAKELKDAAWFIGQRVINREEVIEQAFCALLTAEHLLLQSRTGVGKSLLAEQIFAMFEGARLFRVQASKEQQPDTFFGGLDLEQLKSGRIIHNTQGSLVESQFGFIDEIFDANDFTLRALLSLLNGDRRHELPSCERSDRGPTRPISVQGRDPAGQRPLRTIPDLTALLGSWWQNCRTLTAHFVRAAT
jgi:MoxR-like ATPase